MNIVDFMWETYLILIKFYLRSLRQQGSSPDVLGHVLQARRSWVIFPIMYVTIFSIYLILPTAQWP
jgi:hypothetical protein